MIEITIWGSVTAASLAVCAVALVVIAWTLHKQTCELKRFQRRTLEHMARQVEQFERMVKP